MKDKILVTNIQRFSIHDGPGIRTTVFLKGCMLSCPWCSNPENLSIYQSEFIKNDKTDFHGRYYEVEELFEKIIKDKIYYEGGGVTFSGGEPLLQMTALEPLLKKLKKEKIHICVETSLFAEKEQLEIALKHVDLFYVDIKILNEEECKKHLNGNIDKYWDNLNVLYTNIEKLIYRIPLISNYTDTEENIEDIIKLIRKFPVKQIEILKQHCLGKSKYEALGLKVPDLNPLDENKIDKLRNKLLEVYDCNIVVCEV